MNTRTWYLAITKEATKWVAAKPTKFIRYLDGDILLKQDTIQNSPIQNNRALALGASKGKITAEGNYNVDFDFIESPFFLYWALGSITSTSIGSEPNTVFKHTLTIADCDLPTFSIEQKKGCNGWDHNQAYEVSRAFGAMVDGLAISASDEKINMNVKLKALGVFAKGSFLTNVDSGTSVAIKLHQTEGLVATDIITISDKAPESEENTLGSINQNTRTVTIATLANSYTLAEKAKIELRAQTPSYWAFKPASFTHFSIRTWVDIATAETAVKINIEDWEVSFENAIETRYGSLRSSPSVIAPKGYMMKIKYTKFFENLEERDKYLDLTSEAAVIEISNDEIVSSDDTNNNMYLVKVKAPKLLISSYELPTGNDDLYAASVEWEFYYDDGVGYLAQIEVVNWVAGTMYTS